MIVTGSPPQVRGKQCCATCGNYERGITPAGAGKTVIRRKKNDKTKDHPRRCGENIRSILCRPINQGSPPQVRGKLRLFLLFGMFKRITPAGAGKTLKRSFRNQPFCSGAVQISFNFSNSLNVSLQSGSAR